MDCVHEVGDGWREDYGAARMVEGEATGVGYFLERKLVGLLSRQEGSKMGNGVGKEGQYFGVSNVFILAKVLNRNRIPRLLSINKPLQILDISPLFPLGSLQ